MAVLDSARRRELERTVLAAREAAEAGARAALHALAVERSEPHASMRDEEKALRRRLRAHARQLGDARDGASGEQRVQRLVREIAYEHWHRMLFARFLAENQLLIEPTSEVAMSLEESADLARAAGEDRWAFAARCAERMLPAIFRPDDPALAVVLPPEARQELERLLAAIPSEVFTSDDALGWTYQFWQAAEKKAVNERGEKITGETLPAVTQLFTEHYMVLFLLHNTLGAWHAGKLLASDPDLARSAGSEAELRRAVALPGLEWEYLRFVREEEEGPWRPAAGTFPTWPAKAAELRVLDPCCGSGHFLVAAFEILVRLRMAEEGLGLEPAIRAVLAENLFGLELDPRCTQIAAFHLALAAWKWAGRPIELPPLRIACAGIGPSATKEEWVALAEQLASAGGMPAARDLFRSEDSLLSQATRHGLEALYDTFERAPELGSLIDPALLPGTQLPLSVDSLRPLLERVVSAAEPDLRERAVAAAGMAEAARILIGPKEGYTLVVTNVPYLGRKSHTEEFRAWVDENYKDAKNDLATVFLSRMLRWVGKRGAVAAVTPQNWLFLTGYRKLRERLLHQKSWCSVARLGAGAFETIGGHVVNVALVTIGAAPPRDEHAIAGLDASGVPTATGKASLLRGESAQLPRNERDGPAPESSDEAGNHAPSPDDEGDDIDPDLMSAVPDRSVRLISQRAQLDNPEARIMFAETGSGSALAEHAECYQGLVTGDRERFICQWWEVQLATGAWVLFKGASHDASRMDLGHTEALFWQEGVGSLHEYASATRHKLHDMHESGNRSWGRVGVALGRIGLTASFYAGEHFDNTVAVVTPQQVHLPAIFAFCAAAEFSRSVRTLDRSLCLTNATLLKVPFDLEHWQRIAAERYPEGLPEPQSNDPTQWLFHGHPAGMIAAGPASRSPLGIADPVGAERHPSLICREPNPRDVLQVAVARLVGYRWPAEQDEAMRLDLAARAWVERCRELRDLSDEDGIVCLPALRGEPSAAERLRRLLAAALVYAPGGFTAARERELLDAAAGNERRADSLEEWLSERFFEQHCALFHSRPFVWHISDGRRDGFAALVNYHRLAAPKGEGRRTLESLAFSYLGEWIDRQRAEQRSGTEGADARLAAALALQTELQKILEGEPPYDLFVRWKPLHEQALGWEPDLDDGVRLNIRPFLRARDLGRTGTGVLRSRPKALKWTKDRGKEPESLRPRRSFPWFWGCDPEERPEHRTNFGASLAGSPRAAETFDGQRWNDLHYTRAAKEAARAAAANEAAP